MMRVEAATPQHVQTFALELTPADDLEAQVAGQPSAVAAFGLLLQDSLEAWAVSRDERVGMMLGVRPRADGAGQLWFHSTALVHAHGLAFLRAARPVFTGLLERHGELHGLIDARNPAMVRLARWIGFELGPVSETGPYLFHPAVVRSH